MKIDLKHKKIKWRSNFFRHVNIELGFITSAESEEGIAHAIVRGNIDFERDPWPKVSKEAKELVVGMLDPNPYNRMTVEEVLGMDSLIPTPFQLYLASHFFSSKS